MIQWSISVFLATLGSSQVRRQKQEAVAMEDYDRAMELKDLEKQLENQRQRPAKMAEPMGDFQPEPSRIEIFFKME